MWKKVWLICAILVAALLVVSSETPNSAELKAKIEKLIKDLGSDDYQIREAASKVLEEIGAPAEPFLNKALQNPDAEVRLRTKRLLREIEAKRLGKIAFVRDENIWVMDFDGQNQKQLTNSRRNYHPCWFPDGRRIAFVSFRDNILNVSEICSIDSTGENEKRLLKCTGHRISLTFSPDGKKILFIAHQDKKLQAYVVDSDGRNLKSLTEHLGDYNDAVWSPDSKQIAFLSHQCGDECICAIDADGQNLKRLTNLQGTTRRPFWSPDGERIAFVAYQDEGWGISCIDRNGKNLKQLVKFPSAPTSPVWSPNGRQIAFSQNYVGSDRGIYVVDANEKNLARITKGSKDRNPQWSPDGSKIAFISFKEHSNDMGLYVIDPSGENMVELLEKSYRYGFSFAWSPNGEWIIFEIQHAPHAEPECTEECGCDKVGTYIINVENKRLIKLTDESGKGFMDAATPAWQPLDLVRGKPVKK